MVYALRAWMQRLHRKIIGMKGNSQKKLIKIWKETSDRASIWIRLERNDVGLDTIVNSRMQARLLKCLVVKRSDEIKATEEKGVREADVR